MKQLFEFAIIHNPKQRTDTAGNDTTPPSSIIVAPKHVLGTDEKEVTMRLAREIPDEYLERLDEVQVLVRPF